MADEKMDSAAPPSYESLSAAGTSSDTNDAKGDVKKDDKGNDMLTDARQAASSSSSSQMLAPSGAAKIMDWEEYRRHDKGIWSKGSRRRTTAVYGLYCERKHVYAQPHALKITDYNGGVLYHFLFPLCMIRRNQALLKRPGYIYMAPGDQTISNPRAQTDKAGHAWQDGPEPPKSDSYVWRAPLHTSDSPHFECADGRTSSIYLDLCEAKQQIHKYALEYHRRDMLEFSIPSSGQSETTRRFVWSSGGLPRNHPWSRWDEIKYCMYEKGDLTRIYAKFCWAEGFAIDIREPPEALEHPLIVFALGYLLLMEYDFASQWSAADFAHGGRKDHPAPPLFSVASLRHWAGQWMPIE
ncbi:hypothetical protein BDZ90DRAFT_275723 [Jaminaea rosea]|uniref:Uncharacterized protein n=1 Tax=Jaminaea rosea TaxID=1569628 RepID=A0A316UKP7_9BASI|nr:hypothetical protein BDZ90DRAFT_275723 [Jaminaea rosea]PWN25872.1 hypothetical protein BDZ90DRAFT_275723 [Jaminaea rosea]